MRYVTLLLLAIGFAMCVASPATPAYAEGYDSSDGVYYSDAMIEDAIHANFAPEDWAAAEAIAWCESAYQPEPYGDVSGYMGIFQISYIARVHYHLRARDVDTPYENAYWASVIEADQGWSPWECAY